MSILDARPIESALPTLARPIMSLDQNEDAIVGSLKQSLRQVETLGAQRAGLEDMLKEMKRKDDILPKNSSNIEAQEQLLMQIQAQNDEFSALFNLEDYKASREKCYKQIEAAIAKFREIKDNINEGLKFYVTLQSNDFVMTRNIQCREMIEDVQRQVAGLSFQDKNSGAFSSSYPPVGSQNQRPSTQQTDPRPQTLYYQPPEQPPVSSYGHPPPSNGSVAHQPPPPYHIPPTSAAPYQPHQVHQQAPAEYGQPAYPGWRGPYYNAPAQQPGSVPRPPYTVPSPYPPPHQGGYYKQQ
ncbi:hypothetical protein AHAS_Ahas05G0314600 [Arachis hypogaea]